MSTDNLDNSEDNFVPEPTAANPDGGAERLDADPISESTHNDIDSLLDEAERETAEPNTTSNEQNDTTIQEPSIEAQADALESSSEPVAEPVATSTTDQQPEAVRESKSEIDPEIIAIEQPRNLSEKNQNNWRKLQETASEYKKQAAEAEVLRQRLQEAESKQTQYPQDYEELKKFRQIFDIKNDPDFQSKYTQPINAAKENIYSILKKHGASEDVIKSIEEAGGPDKIDDKWWQNNALSKLPMTDAERLKRNLIDVMDLKEKQEGEIAYAAQNAEQILAERQTKQAEYQQQEQAGIYNYVEEITKDVPWARFQEIPRDATPEQIEKIQQHNQSVQGLQAKFNSALNPQTPDQKAAVAAAAVLSHRLTEQLRTEQSQRNDLEAQIKRLTEENNKLKGAYKMPKSSINTPASNKPSDISSRIKMSASDAIDMGLDEAGA